MPTLRYAPKTPGVVRQCLLIAGGRGGNSIFWGVDGVPHRHVVCFVMSSAAHTLPLPGPLVALLRPFVGQNRGHKICTSLQLQLWLISRLSDDPFRRRIYPTLQHNTKGTWNTDLCTPAAWWIDGKMCR